MQEITFDELSTLKQPSASLRTALDKISAALGSVGDAGQQARSVVDELRVSLRAAAAQSVKSARSLAKFDEINRLSAPAEDKTAAPEKQQKAAEAAAKAEKAARSTTGTAARRSGTAGSDLSGLTAVWQSVLESLRGAWADFWAYLQEFFAPFAAAWQTVWQGLSAAAAGVWEQLCAALSTVVQPALALLDTVWQGLWAGMEQAWAAYGQPILDGLAQGWQNVVGIVSALWSEVLQPVLVQLFDLLGALWTAHLQPLWNELTACLGAVTTLLLTLWNTVLAPFVQWLITALAPVAVQVFAALGTAVTGAAGIIADGITIALAVLRGMADFLTAVLRGEWDAAWAAMAATVSTVWGRIVSIVQTAVSTVLGVVRSMVAAIAAAINGLLSAIGHAKSMAGSVLGGAGKLVLVGLGIRAFRRRGGEFGLGRGRDGVGGHEVLADGGVESGEREQRAVAGADEVFVGLGKLGFEVQDVGLDRAAGGEALAGDAEAFLDALDRLGLDVGEGLRLQDAVEAAGDFVDELVACGGEGLCAGFGTEAGHVLARGALQIEQPPLGADAAADVFGILGLVGIERGVLHVQLPLVELHHEGLDRIVAAGVGSREADGRIVVGPRLREQGLGGIDAAGRGLQRGGVLQRGGDGVVEGDGPRGGGGHDGGKGEQTEEFHERAPFLARMQFKMVSERWSPTEYQTSLPRRSDETRPARSIFFRWPETPAWGRPNRSTRPWTGTASSDSRISTILSR